MPLYEFECEQCCGRFEQIKTRQEAKDSKCPICGGKVRRLFSPFSFSFGWRLSDESNYVKGTKDTFVKDI